MILANYPEISQTWEVNAYIIDDKNANPLQRCKRLYELMGMVRPINLQCGVFGVIYNFQFKNNSLAFI
ncbi:MAG: hypothetical protein CVU90_01125 [Firmicutes bacterium HGW-Firmicutes-15]|nr:MAG: hypothetical protein CVU90_01125 [Firmicutes bacterium HGW-Firmicutes-15]